MTAEERRRLLAKEFEEDDKDTKPSKKNSSKEIESENDNEGKKGSAAKKVAGVAIGLGAVALAAGGIKAAISDHSSESGDDNAIVYDDAELTGVDKEIADETARISEIQEKLTKASEKLSATDNKVFATAEKDGKFKDMIFDVDGDGREEDFVDQFNNKLASYQARLTQISAIEDDTERAVQFALLREEMKDIKMVLDTNSNENVYENKIKVIQDGYNQNENKAAKATYNHIANLYGENPVFTYEGDLADIERFADSIVNGTDTNIKVTAFETETRLENGRFVNDESLLNGQEITLDLVNKREQVKTVTKTVEKTNTIYVPVVKPTPAPSVPGVTPGTPQPGPENPDVPLPDPVIPPAPVHNEETQTIVNPAVPTVQTKDIEDKLPETIVEQGGVNVNITEETQGAVNAQVGPAVYEGHEPTQSYDFDAIASVYDSYIESACEDYAEADVSYEESQTIVDAEESESGNDIDGETLGD